MLQPTLGTEVRMMPAPRGIAIQPKFLLFFHKRLLFILDSEVGIILR